MKFNKDFIKNVVRENAIVGFFLLFFVALGEIYVFQSARNVVFMDFWININKLITPTMTGELRWEILWGEYMGHRNPLELSILAFNIKYMGLNCIWEIYAGMIVIAFTGMALYFEWKRNTKDSDNTNNSVLMRQLMFLPVILALFSLNQWEILSLQFSFVFMLRIFGYVSALVMLNYAMQNRTTSAWTFLGIGIYIGILIDLLSQLYWAAFVITLFITWIVYLIQTNIKENLKKIFVFWIPIIFSIGIYLNGLKSVGAENGMNMFWGLLKSGEFFKAISYMLVGSLFPQSKIMEMKQSTIVIMGVILQVIIMLAIISYFRNNLINKTYVPMMLCAYGLLSIPIITYGRAKTFDLMYLTSSRYTVETTLIWAGCLLVFANVIYSKKNTLLWMPIIMITIMLMYSDGVEFQIAPFRGHGKDQLIEIEENLSDYEDDELNGFQASPELVRQGTELMKKYSLNIFAN